MNNKLKRNCECCKASYATGKDYGDYWCILSSGELIKINKKWWQFWKKSKEWRAFPFKGLCEFCNPSNLKWYINDKLCHQKK